MAVAFEVVRKIGKYRYKYEVEAYRDPETKRPRQRILRFFGRVDTKGNIVVPGQVRVDSVHSAFPVGPLSLFTAVADSLQLQGHIQRSLQIDPDTAGHVLCLALNQLCHRRPLTKLSDWVVRSPLPDWLDLDPARISRDSFQAALNALCHRTRDHIIEDRGLVLQKDLTAVWRNGGKEPAQYYYDVTKRLYYGSTCPYAEPGYFPGGTHKNVIGFGMVVSRTHSHPVLCRAIPGSRHDTLTVEDVVQHLRAWGFRHLTLIMDRGMVSAKNVEFLVRSGYDQVGIVPATNTEAWSYLTHWTPEQMERAEHLVERGSRNDDNVAFVRAWTAPLFGRTRMRVALVASPSRRQADLVGRERRLAALERTTDRSVVQDARDELGPLVRTARGRRGFSVDEHLVREDRQRDGRFLLFSTDLSLSGTDLFRIYFQRDEIEKAFHIVNGELTLGPFRYRAKERIDADTTVMYLAYLLWSVVARRLRAKFGQMSVPEALGLVEDVAQVRFGSGKLERVWVTRLAAEQRKVLKYLGAVRLLGND